MRVSFAVSDSVMMENMLRLVATDPLRSSMSSLDKRFAFFRMSQSILLEIFIFEVFASARMEDISLLEPKTS